MSTAMRPDRPRQKTDFLRNQFGIEGDEISSKSIRIIDERIKSGKCPAETEGDEISLKNQWEINEIANSGGDSAGMSFRWKSISKTIEIAQFWEVGCLRRISL